MEDGRRAEVRVREGVERQAAVQHGEVASPNGASRADIWLLK